MKAFSKLGATPSFPASSFNESSPGQNMNESPEEPELIVYVVDDDSISRKVIAMDLEQHGFCSREFSTAQAFLDAVHPPVFGCLLLDFQLPGLNGIELQKLMIEREFQLPIVFVSEKANISVATAALRDGALDLLEKPIDPKVLVERLNQAFAGERNRFEKTKLSNQLQAGINLLTSKELEVLPLIYEGLSLKQIANHFDFTIATASRHQSRVFDKLGVESSVQLIHLVQAANFDIDKAKTTANS